MHQRYNKYNNALENTWVRFFENPSMWWDNRGKTWITYPDFKHATTGEKLWLDSAPRWVHGRLPSLSEVAPGKLGLRARLKASDLEETTTVPKLLAEMKTCTELERGKLLHTIAVQTGCYADKYVAAALVSMYSRLGSMRNAREVFEEMTHRDAVSWTSLVGGYVEQGENVVALDVFMCMDCGPDLVAFVAVLKACSGLAGQVVREFCVEKGMYFHRLAREHGVDLEILVASNLVDLYSKCGNMAHARAVFNKMMVRDIVSWNIILLGYLENGESLIALDVFWRVDCEPSPVTLVAGIKACTALAESETLERLFCLEKGVEVHRKAKELGLDSDTTVANTLMDMYSKLKNMKLAREVFNTMTNRDVVSWNVLILGYQENGASLTSLDLFTSMDCEPNYLTFVGALKACASIGSLAVGQRIHTQICKLGLEQNQMVATSLVDLYGKCGSMDAAEQVFNRMLRKDTVAWNALIAGYCSSTSQVFSLMKRMQEAGLQPSAVTFLSVLTACSHLGLVEEGKEYFESMPAYGITPTPEHCSCMFDMLGRAHKLQEAVSLLQSLPVQTSAMFWTTFLRKL